MAASSTFTATDDTSGVITAPTSPATTVNAGAATKLQILMPGETAAPGSATGKTGAPSAQTAGGAFTVTVNEVDANWNLVSSTDTVAITSTDANATLPANAALVAGTKTFSVTPKTAASSTFTATDTSDGTKTANTSPATTVNASAATKLQILMPGETAAPGTASGKTGAPSAQTAGGAFTVTVNEVDANWNVVSSTDTIAITSTDANAALPANAALVAGTKTFSITAKTAGSKTFTATDVTNGGITANTSPATTINAGAATKLQILMPGETAAPGTGTGKTGAPSAQTAGGAFTVTVNEVDANWNVVSSTDTIAISSTDANAALPANAALVAGTKTFSVTPKTAASSTFTATDTSDGTKTANTSPATSVNVGAATKLQILMPGETAAPGTGTGKTGAPSAQTAGGAFTVTVNEVDANWNVVSSTDTIAISSSDGNAALPVNAALVAGTKTFSVTPKTAASSTFTATDVTSGGITANTSPATTVNAGAFAKLQILMPGETAASGTGTGKTGSPTAQTAGSLFTVTVNAVDANWNPVTATDTVALSTSDTNATPPAPAALAGGTQTFSIALATAGSSTVTATDQTDGSKTANTSPATTVNAGAFAKLQILLPGETAAPGTGTGKTGTPTAQNAGGAFTATVNAVDANWNLVSSTDTIAITSTDANATLPANAALVAGTKTVSITPKTAGSKTFTATDTSDGTKTANTSPATTINAGAFAKLQILMPGETAAPGTGTGKTGTPTAQNAGGAFTATVNAVDANWNLVSSTDTIAITSTDANATLPANAALVAGTKTFSITPKTAGSKTFTATDTSDGTKTANTSPATTINASGFTKLQVLLPGETAAPGTATGKTGVPSAQTAGIAFTITVNAVDANWNPVSSTDTMAITSSDGNAILPSNAALVAGTKTFSVAAKSAGTATFIATDATDGSKTPGSTTSATINAAAFAKLQILMPGESAAPGTVGGKSGSPFARTAGNAFAVTVNAVDAFWNPVSSTDTVAITSSDANAALPANAALVAGTKTYIVTAKTAGSATFTATDATDGTKNANTGSATTINAAAFSKLQILLPGETAAPGTASGKTGAPTPQTAGSSFSVTANAVDSFWNPVSSTDTVALSTSDASATAPAPAALLAGTKTYTVTLPTAGSTTITATDQTDGSKAADTSPAVTVGAGAFAKLQILLPGETAAPGTATGKTGTPSNRTAGSSFSVTVNAVDANWNPVSSTDTVAITSTDANATLPANAALVAGTKTFTLTPKTAGSATFTATDASDGTKNANTSPSTTINGGAFAKLQILLPGETAAPGTATGKTGSPSNRTTGSSFSVTVNAVDANWNVVASTDTAAITSTDANATLPANAALVAGTKNFTVTAKTAGTATFTSADATDGSKPASTSPSVTVDAGAFAKLQILLPGETAAPGTATGKTGTPTSRTAGSAFTVTVNAVDADWNPVTATDTVAITSSDANASLPANAALVAGTKSFSVTPHTAGSFTFTATDASDGSKSPNTSAAATVNAGGFAKLQILLPGETAAPGTATGKTGTPTARTAGSAFTVTVNAVDADWNPVTATDTVAISSSDTNATLPANAALVAGTKTFSVTPKTAGSATFTATDTTDGAKTANTSPASTINAGAFAKLQILLPGETAAPGTASGKTGTPNGQTAGTGFSVTVNAVDANWNPVSATDTVALSTSDTGATPPAPAALAAGTGTFTLALATAGSATVTVTDQTDGTKTPDTSPAASVTAGAFAKLQLLLPGETAAPGTASGKTGTPSSQAAGTAFTATVNAVDANWNLVSSTDAIAITSSDAQASLPANAALVAGTKNFTVTLRTTGGRTVTATDATNGSKTPNTSPSATVTSTPTAPTLGVPLDTATVSSLTPTLSATFASPDATITGKVTFQLCSTNTCSTVLQTFDSTSTSINVGNAGSAPYSGGTALVDGNTYYWRAKNVDANSNASAYSSIRSFVVNTTAVTMTSATVGTDGTTVTVTWSGALDTSQTTIAGSAFSVTPNGGSAITGTASTVTYPSSTETRFTLSAPVHHLDSLTLDYTKPGSGASIRDLATPSANIATDGTLPNPAITNNTSNLAPSTPALVTPAGAQYVSTLTPTLTANFSDVDTQDLGKVTFQVCSASDCSTVLQAVDSTSTSLAVDSSGSATYSGGTALVDGNTYYWRAKNVDSSSAASSYSAIRSFTVDTSGPANAFSLTGVSTAGGLPVAFYPGSGSTIFYNGSLGAGAKSFTLSAATTDPGSGGASITTSGFAANGSNMSHANGTSTSPGSGTFDANSFSFTPTTSGNPTFSAITTDAVGNISASTSFTVRNDTTAPTGGTLSIGGFSSTLAVSPNVTALFAEAASGTAAGLKAVGGNALVRTQALPTGAGTCPAAASITGSPTTVSGSLTSTGTVSDTVPTDGLCYAYTLTGTDNVGNTASAATVVLVDTTAPAAPSANAFSATTNAYYPGIGSTVFFKGGAAGGFTVTASGASDAESGIAGYTYPSLGAGWSNTAGVYSFTAAAGTQTGGVTAQNNAGLSSAGTSFTAQADTSAPTSSVTCNSAACSAGWYTSSPVAISIAAAGESGASGVQLITYTTDGTDPTSSGTATAVTAATASFNLSTLGTSTVRWIAEDNVGNVSAISSQTVELDTTAPSAPSLGFSGLSGAYYSGTGSTVFFDGGTTGGFSVDASGSADAQSGVSGYTYPSLGSGWTQVAGAYTFDATAATQSGSVTAQNNAGLTSAISSFTARADSTVPTSSMTCNTNPCGTGWINSTPVDIAINGDDGTGSGVKRIVYTTDGTDPTSSGTATTVNAATATFQLSTAGTIKWFAVDNLLHASSVQSKTLQIDGTPPSAPTGVAFSGISNGYWPGSGTTIFFKGGSAGTFTVAASGAADAQSGLAPYSYPSLGSGWTNTAGDYSFDATAGTQSGSIAAENNAGLASTSGLNFTAQSDASAPTSSISCSSAACSAGWYTSSPVAISIATGGESGASGVKQILYTTDGTDPTTSGTATIVSAASASFNVTALGSTTVKWAALDNVGNVSAVATQVVELDTTAPTAPAIGFSGFNHAYYAGSGSTVFFQGGGSGGFTVTAGGSTESDSALAGYTYPSLGSGWSNTAGDYTFNGSAATQSGSVTAQNTAGLSSSGTGFTAQADASAPTTSATCNAVACAAGWYTSSPVAVAITAAGETGASGVKRVVYTTNGVDPVIDASDIVTSGTEVSGASASFTISAEGTTTVKWIAEDNVGNIAGVGTKTIKLDSIAPNTSIGAKPSDPSSNATPTFGFSSNEAGATFECSVDGGAYSACITPLTLPTVGEGAHTFAVRAIDVAGNLDASPASYGWTVDTVPPAASMTDPGAHVSGTISLQSTSTDIGGTGIAGADFEIRTAGGGTWTPISNPWNTKTGADAVADGLYDIHVVARDNAGNNAASTPPISNLRVDNTAPSVNITNPLSNGGLAGTVTLTAPTTDADPTPTVVWQVAPHGTTTWTTVPATWNTKTGPDAVADGQYDVQATATDWAGNVGSATVTTVTVDNQPPTVDTTVPADGSYVNAASADPFTVSATANDNGTGVQQVVFSSCTTATCVGGTVAVIGTDAVGSAGTYSTAWTIPADGSYWIRAVATDNVGHASTSINAVTVDRTLPDTTILTKPGDPTNLANPAFTFSASEAAQGFECKLDGGAWTACTSPRTLGVTPADGSHTFQVRAIDLAGNTDASADSWTWNEDRTSPTATLTDPAAANAAHAIRGIVGLASTTNDPATNGYASGVDNATLTYEYSADGTTWAPIAAPAAWDTTAVTDGVYGMHVLITDRAGNVTTSPVVASVKIDNTQPLTAQDDPGAFLRSTITLTGTAADPNDPQGGLGSGIDHVDFQVSAAGANSWSTVGTGVTSPYTASFDTTTLTDGHYDFRTVAYDVAGNVTNATAVGNRLVDNTAPTAQIVDPGANLHLTVNLATDPAGTTDPGGANASGIVATSFEIFDGTTWSPVSASWNTTGVPDGVYDIRATVTDAAGNVSAPSVVGARRVDNTKPVTTAAGVPSGFSASDVTVSLNASDTGGSGVTDTLYQVDGGAVQHGTSVLIPAPSNGSNDGSHTIAFQSVDAAGNIETQQSVTVRIDATPPVCPTCSASDYVSGTVSLTATPTDSGAGIASVAFQYSANGTSGWTTIGTATTATAGVYSISWNTTTPGDGAWHLRARITDAASNVSSIDLHAGGAGVVVVDNTAPTAAVGAPTAGSFVSGSSVSISATSGDANPLTYAFLVNGSVVSSGTSSSATWDSTSVADGPAQLTVRATDPAGNATTSAVVTVTVDNHSPTPSVNDPGTALAGPSTISATTDADTATIAFEGRVQGAPIWVPIATVGPPFQTVLATGSLPDGPYELRAIATDGAGHTGTSATRTVTIDNTLPTGSITQPTAGLTIGGPTSALHATATDAGSGVQSVEFQYTLHGANAWTSIATVNAAPYNTTWNASALATNDYDLRILVKDNAGNVRTTTPIMVHVDSTAPTPTFNDPGVNLAGTVPLSATTAGPDAVSVSFEISPAGANTWQPIATDNATPWAVSFDTTTLPDGLYDIRARAIDALGNVGTAARTSIRIDNTAPSVTGSTPADGTIVSSASSIVFDVSEITTLSNLKLDSLPTVAPTITGTHVDFATGALGDGPHTLSGTLTDASGKTSPLLLHFTVYTAGSTPLPYVEKNMRLASATSLVAPGGATTATMPAHAWSPTVNPGDWLVLRIAPEAPSTVSSTLTLDSSVDVTARWAVAGGMVHQFDNPLVIDLGGPAAASDVPATTDGSAWRLIRPLSTAGQLPADWTDGYWRSDGVVHVLTRHLTRFALVQDQTPPQPPTDLNGTVNSGQLTLRWTPTHQAGKEIANFVLFADDQPISNLGATELEYTVGTYDPNDPRAYSIVETDTSGNASVRSAAIKVVPTLAGLTLDSARTALTAKGFGVGDITVVDSQAPAGTIVGPTNGITAAVGAVLPLQVSAGAGQHATKFVFSVIGTKRLTLAQRRYIGVHVSATRATTLSATLVNARHARVYTWHVSAKAGVSIIKLTLPRSARRQGRYTLLWTATSSGEVLRTTMPVRFVKTAKIAAALTRGNRKPKAVVLAGAGLPAQLSGHPTGSGPKLVASSSDSAFTLTGDPHRNVAVVVVDADQYSLGLVHDLRTVFPTVRIVALTSDPRKLSRAVRAGATVALSKRVPNLKLVKVVATLTAPPRTTASR